MKKGGFCTLKLKEGDNLKYKALKLGITNVINLNSKVKEKNKCTLSTCEECDLNKLNDNLLAISIAEEEINSSEEDFTNILIKLKSMYNIDLKSTTKKKLLAELFELRKEINKDIKRGLSEINYTKSIDIKEKVNINMKLPKVESIKQLNKPNRSQIKFEFKKRLNNL